MISVNNVTLRIGKKALFEDVNIKFTEGNCYGVIGANGAGKSTFLRILSGDLETTSGTIVITPGQRLSVLEQDHFKYDDYSVMDTVIMGNARLYEIMKEKDAIYAKEDFSDEDGIRVSDLEAEFAEMDGWEAESNAAMLLNGLGIDTDFHYSTMKDLDGSLKVKVLLAKALFGNPDILLLDEPTNHLDLDAIAWLEDFLIDFENTVIVVSHDRYFLNKVCTHTADIDYNKIQLYAGNYDFWYESSQLLVRQMKEANKKKEEKIKELQEFISRFSANASKSKQATSRKRALEKIELDDIRPSSRKYPYIDFRPDREIGNEVLTVEHLSKTVNGEKVLDDISFVAGHDDKIAFVGSQELAKTTLFGVVPLPIVIFLLMLLCAYLLLHRSKYGRKVFLVGVNPQAAEYSGINARAVVMSTYILSGLAAGITGVVMTSQLGIAKSDLGGNFTMMIITACVLGGTLSTGGKGSAVGTALAAIAITLLRFGMPLCFNINKQYLDIPIGVLLVAVVVGRSLASNPNVVARAARLRPGKKPRAAQ